MYVGLQAEDRPGRCLRNGWSWGEYSVRQAFMPPGRPSHVRACAQDSPNVVVARLHTLSRTVPHAGQAAGGRSWNYNTTQAAENSCRCNGFAGMTQAAAQGCPHFALFCPRRRARSSASALRRRAPVRIAAPRMAAGGARRVRRSDADVSFVRVHNHPAQNPRLHRRPERSRGAPKTALRALANERATDSTHAVVELEFQPRARRNRFARRGALLTTATAGSTARTCCARSPAATTARRVSSSVFS